MTMAEMKPGDTATVYGLISEGSIRRRLQELGLIPGTEIKCVHKSPLGDPVAFTIKSSVIALRREDSSTVFIQVG